MEYIVFGMTLTYTDYCCIEVALMETSEARVESDRLGGKDEKPSVPEERLRSYAREKTAVTAKPDESKPQGQKAKTNDVTPAARKSKAVSEEKSRGKEKPALDPALQSAALAQTIVGSFIDRLKSECAKKGGVLKSNDLDDLGKEFEKKTVALQKAFQLSFEETIRARERSILNSKRTDCFERMMVEIISHLLADDMEKPIHGERISRRALPGFLLTLDKMLGDDVIDGFRKEATDIVERFSEDNGDDFNWSGVHQSEEVRNLVLKTLVVSANHFDDLKRRGEWFITVLNSHLGATTSSMHEAHAVWEFDGKDFNALMNAYFKPMAQALGTEAGRLRIARIHGVETIGVLVHLLKELGGKAGK